MSFQIQRGDPCRIDGVIYEFTHRTLTGEYSFKNGENGYVKQLPEKKVLAAFTRGEIAFRVPVPDELKPFQQANIEADFAFFDPEIQAIARRRKAYVDRILDERPQGPRSQTWPQILDRVREELGAKTAPSWHSVARWMKPYVAGGCDLRLLVPGYTARGRHRQPRLPDEEQLIKEVLSRWLAPEQPTKDWIYEQLKMEYAKARREIPGATAWRLPSRATVNRWLNRIDLYERVRRREGLKAAERLLKPVGPGKPASYRLEVVEIDHTRLDLWVIDETEGLLLGRPWLTAAIDRYTRMIVGLYIGFEPPSVHSVMQCLRSMILPKTEFMAAFPGLEWTAYGIPVTIVVDNGVEFRSDSFRDVCAQLGITIAQQPVDKPQFKGIVERWFRTLGRSGLTWMPGRTFSNVAEKGDYDAPKHACITQSDFRRFFLHWMLAEYCYKTHDGIMDVPARRWEEEVQREPVRLPRHIKDLDALLGLMQTRTITNRGIRFRGLFYHAPELARIRRNPALSNTVIIKVNPGDLGTIQVIHPGDGHPITAVAHLEDYARGLTLFQHELIRALLRKRNQSFENQAHVVQARMDLQEASWAALKRRGTKNRSRVTRQAGIGVTQPQADILAMMADPDKDLDLMAVLEEDAAEDAAEGGDVADRDPAAQPTDEAAGRSDSPSASSSAAAASDRKPARGRRSSRRRTGDAAGGRSRTPEPTPCAPLTVPLEDDDDDVVELPVLPRGSGGAE